MSESTLPTRLSRPQWLWLAAGSAVTVVALGWLARWINVLRPSYTYWEGLDIASGLEIGGSYRSGWQLFGRYLSDIEAALIALALFALLMLLGYHWLRRRPTP
ncbi:MAG: hypothetical protein KDD73_01650 [Anaerolineales bacterium]|nr:hypothetical protein [Anaerolineales bacterium]MCB9127433.1 hypothetical protein [Ardenticatenales bacterium]MCB9172234.1 hypothetical protein [Ardenticatenales bacterium]